MFVKTDTVFFFFFAGGRRDRGVRRGSGDVKKVKETGELRRLLMEGQTRGRTPPKKTGQKNSKLSKKYEEIEKKK